MLPVFVGRYECLRRLGSVRNWRPAAEIPETRIPAHVKMIGVPLDFTQAVPNGGQINLSTEQAKPFEASSLRLEPVPLISRVQRLEYAFEYSLSATGCQWKRRAKGRLRRLYYSLEAVVEPNETRGVETGGGVLF